MMVLAAVLTWLGIGVACVVLLAIALAVIAWPKDNSF